MMDKMQEIGGYFELDEYKFSMLHEKAIPLNCGRACLSYVIEARGINKIALPYFICESVISVCRKYNVEVKFYSIDTSFSPYLEKVEENDWVYIVNYYGQLSREYIKEIVRKYRHVIIDHSQAYFEMPFDNADTLYTCRKFFGVADGAFLYTNKKLDRELPKDESFRRIQFVLGRFERTATEFYQEAAANNDFFDNEPIKNMSKLTHNLLHAIDYEQTEQQRRVNFEYIHQKLYLMNELNVKVPKGPFMYPLYFEGAWKLRKELSKKKIYIPLLWPDVLERCDEKSVEYNFALNILPLPIDQRYGREEMDRIIDEIKKLRNEG